MPLNPEQQAREHIDAQLVAAGWLVQSRDEANLHAGRGVAVREFRLLPGHGFADYLLFVDHKAVGVIEAKKVDETLSGVEIQTEQYSVCRPSTRRRSGRCPSCSSPQVSRPGTPTASILTHVRK